MTRLILTGALLAIAAMTTIPANADTGELISALSSQLGVTEEQAAGGAAAMNLLKGIL